MNKVLDFLSRAFRWVRVPANRRRVYTLLAALGPVLALAGFVTPDQVDTWLRVAAGVLMLGGGSLAAKHTDKTSTGGAY